MGATICEVRGVAARDEGDWPDFTAGKDREMEPFAWVELRTVEPCATKVVEVDEDCAAELDILGTGLDVRRDEGKISVEVGVVEAVEIASASLLVTAIDPFSLLAICEDAAGGAGEPLAPCVVVK